MLPDKRAFRAGGIAGGGQTILRSQSPLMVDSHTFSCYTVPITAAGGMDGMGEDTHRGGVELNIIAIDLKSFYASVE